MQHCLLVQNIEEMRMREGIDDEELRKEIRAIRIGDCVRLTLLTEQKPQGSETVAVRITKIDGSKYRGELVHRPISKGLNTLPDHLAFDFRREHIHSLQKHGDELDDDGPDL